MTRENSDLSKAVISVRESITDYTKQIEIQGAEVEMFKVILNEKKDSILPNAQKASVSDQELLERRYLSNIDTANFKSPKSIHLLYCDILSIA